MSTHRSIESEMRKNPEQLEREIEARRQAIVTAVEALEHKLSPGDLFERSLGLLRGNGGEFARNLGASVRANPLPAVLTAVGLAWLMSKPGASPTMARGEHLAADVSERLQEAGDRLSDSGHRAAESMRRSAQSARQNFEGLLHEQPLAVGAIGIAAGALLAALLPRGEQAQPGQASAGSVGRDASMRPPEGGVGLAAGPVPGAGPAVSGL